MKTPIVTASVVPPEYETLSSSTLFHFTKDFDTLKLILKNGFCPRYSLEDLRIFDYYNLNNKNDQLSVGIPMVCYCDIPLSKIKNHLSWYGGYGIGMEKDWGLQNKVTPVMYFDNRFRQSASALNLKQSIDQVYEDEVDEKGLLVMERVRKRLSPLDRLSLFFKPYEGYFEHNGRVETRKRFYDEREWRYVPDVTDTNIPQLILNGDNYESQRIVNNDLLKRFSLEIVPDQIRYIIVQDKDVVLPDGETSSELLEMMRFIDKVFGKLPFSADSIQTLKTKIITTRQIQEDF